MESHVAVFWFFVICNVMSCLTLPKSDHEDNVKWLHSVLGRIGYFVNPDYPTNWMVACSVLATKHKSLEQRIQSLEKQLQGREKELEDSEKRHQDSEKRHQDSEKRHQDCEEQHQGREKDLEKNLQKSREQCLMYEVVFIIRNDLLVFMEDIFRAQHIFPVESKDILADLKNTPSEYPETITPACLESIKQLPNDTNEHTLIWLHFLAFSDQVLPSRMRDALLNNTIDALVFCTFIGDIFQKISPFDRYARYPMINANAQNAELIHKGMTMFGITCDKMLECITVLFKIPNMATIYKPSSTRSKKYTITTKAFEYLSVES
ncbi:uncharacterized protein LOC135837375 isoform X1 [Planococcus citri]|uniref:uncharacterized protein LOC135837375 isoform X1 n=1 Tax=Planococcus citri TaxID=170843 RepID=UPI0031F9F8F1